MRTSVVSFDLISQLKSLLYTFITPLKNMLPIRYYYLAPDPAKNPGLTDSRE
tara:strand:- start:840 stop:995 length:156 start_codon:yes stop_codon:yes gene_type:complete